MPSWTSAAAWPIEPPFYGLVALAMTYHHGGRRRSSTRQRSIEWRLRPALFYLGLVSIALALDSPLEAVDTQLFAAHMAQHVILLSVAPALIVLSAPWSRLWWIAPLGVRRTVAKTFVRSQRAKPLRAAGHGLSHPLFAWTLFNVNLLVWHLPSLYDLTLRNTFAHDAEHTLFLSTGILFWMHAVDSPPVHARLGHVARSAYLVGAIAVGWLLSLVLAFASSPLYPGYAHLAHRPGGLSALADQQLAAGVMWVPGSIAYTIAALFLFYRWLAPEPMGGPRSQRPAVT